MEEKPEPYMPYDFGPIIEDYAGRSYRAYKYRTYQGTEWPWTEYAYGKDELACFMDAMKRLNQLKKRADKYREKKEQTK